MKLKEYEAIKDYSYRDYCKYLQEKYGFAVCAYMTRGGNKKPEGSRTKEGLFAHHIYEDTAIRLSDKECAMDYPYEWQMPENLVYCDFLEHLLLHVMICEGVEKFDKENPLGFGLVEYIVPELNDVYSGWKTKLDWKMAQHQKIINDRKVYLKILKRFKKMSRKYPYDMNAMLCRSYNEKFGLWNSKDNAEIYFEIMTL